MVDFTKAFNVGDNGLALGENQDTGIFSSVSDPSTGLGQAAPVGSLLLCTVNEGNPFIKSNSGNTDWTQLLTQDPIQDAGLLTGFVDMTSSYFSTDNSTRTFSIIPTASSFEVYSAGRRIYIASSLSIVIPNIEGLVYFFIDSNGALQYQTTNWVAGQIQVAYAYWGTTQEKFLIVADHRRGMGMSYATYDYLNNSSGPQLEDGLALSSFTLSGTGALDADAQISMTDGTILDGDLVFTITNSPTPTAELQQILNGPAQLPILSYVGPEINPLLYLYDATAFPIKAGTLRAQVPFPSGGTWAMSDAQEGAFICAYIIATSNIHAPIISVVDFNQYTTLNEAKTNFNWSTFINQVQAGPLTQYARPLYALIYQTSSTFTNSIKAKLVATENLQLVIPSGAQIDHSDLSGLDSDDHPQYVHNSIARTITAQHTFAPLSAQAPFTLGSNALDQLVTGLNADYLDGYHASSFQLSNSNLTALASEASTGIYVITGAGTSAVRSITSSAGTTVVTNGSGVSGNINIDLQTVGFPVSNSFDKITTDSYGRVTGTSAATSSDITSVLGFTPLNKAGDTMSGALNMGNHQINNVIMAGTPASSDAATVGYVNSIATGLIWLPSVEVGNLISDAGGPPATPLVDDTYIIGTGDNTGVWSSFAVGDVVQYQASTWVLIEHSSIGDRYGVAFTSTTSAGGSFTGHGGNIVQISGGSAGAWTYTFTSPLNNYAVSISNALSLLYGDSFTYSTSLSQWIPFSTSIRILAGSGLYYSPSTTLNIGTASSSRIVVNTTNIDLAITGVTAGTYTKPTIDAYGRVTSATNLSSSDITTALTFTPQASNSNLTALASEASTGIYVITGAGTSTVRSIAVPSGMSITNASGVAGNPTIALAGELAAVQGLATTGLTARTGAGTWTTRSIAVPTGLSITNADGVAGNPTIALTTNLLSIEGVSTNGFIGWNSSTSGFVERTFTGQANQISISNGDSTTGNPTISFVNNPIIPGTGSITIPSGTLAQQPASGASGSSTIGMLRFDSSSSKFEGYDGAWENIATEAWTSANYQPLNSNLAALAGVGAGPGIYVVTAAGTGATRSMTSSGSTLTITNPTGFAGNINLDIASTYVGQSSITTLGTISTGTWGGTAIAATHGGTGQTTFVAGDILYASSTTALSRLPIGSTGQILTVTAGLPSWVSDTDTSGTVTTVSVASSNGFAGTVATATSTPVITISTSVSGLIKGNGTSISAATAGTDYSSGTAALTTGILKSTATTGALSIAVAADFPTLNQNTTGTAAIATNVTVTDNTSLAATVYPTWVTANTGNLPPEVSSTKLSFNPSTGTLSSTVFAGSGASLTNIPNTALTNSSITITAGTGMSGGGATALGGSVTLTNAGVTSNAAGFGIGVSSSTGAVTISNTGVTAFTSGTGLSINTAATGSVSVTNTGVTSIVAGTGIGVSGATGAVTITSSIASATQANNTIFAGPATGGPLAPAFRTISLAQNDLSDVTITSPAANQLLTYNGTKWVNTGATGTSAAGNIGVSPAGGGTGWTLVTGTIYTANFVHNLGTTNVVITLYDTNDNSVVIPHYMTTSSATTVTIQVSGNTKTLKVVVIANGNAIAAGGSTPSSVITSLSGVTVSTAATKLNFSGQAINVVDAGSGTTNISIGSRFTFYANSLDSPNSADWTVNAFAPVTTDPTYSSLSVRSFSNTVEQGIGYLLSIPTGATSITFRIRGRSGTAPAAASNVQPRIYARLLPNNTAIGAWAAGINLTPIAIPTNANFQYYVYTATLASLSLTAGNLYQIELTRYDTGVTSNLAYPFYMAEMTVEIS